MDLNQKQVRRLGWIALALLLAASVPVFAQPARVQFTSASDQSGTPISSLQSPVFTPTAGNTLVVWFSYYRNGSSTVTVTASDLAGNTWNCTSIPGHDVGAGGVFSGTGGGCYTHNISGTLTNDQVTVSFSASRPYVVIIPIEYSATGSADPLDATATGTTSAGASVTSGTFTTTNTHEVISCGLIAQNGQTWTAGLIGGSSASLVTSVASAQTGAEDLAVSSTQTGITAAAGIGGNTDLAIICATFTAGGGSAPKPACTRMLLGVGCVAPPATVRKRRF